MASGGVAGFEGRDRGRRADVVAFSHAPRPRRVERPRVPDAGQRHAGHDDRAADDLPETDRLAQEDEREDDRERRDQRLEGRHAGRPQLADRR